jgi:hypothetical protein
MHAADELRRHLNQVIEILQPYALSSGGFQNTKNLETAIGLARLHLSRAERLTSCPEMEAQRCSTG